MVKKKNILFEQFKSGKGASWRYRLKFIFWDVKAAIQRALYGYDDVDVYDLSFSFAERYLEVFKQFQNSTSYPDGMTYEDWKSIISKMIGLLEKMGQDEFKGALQGEDSPVDWDIIKKTREEKVAAKEEFFELFSLFFFDLWD